MPLQVLVLALVLASLAARAEDPVVSLGKQRAAASRLHWEIGDGSHPVLGPIRFAVLKDPVATAVGNASVSSRAYVSCERNSTTIAIELANATAADDPNGLRPRVPPRLVCSRMAPGGRTLSQRDLAARWEVNAIGDALARGLRPVALRECVSIGIVQEVVLPKAWGRESARVEFEIAPYGRELDSIFYTCGERSAFAPKPAPAPVAARPSPSAAHGPWKAARTVASGRTNLRAGPSAKTAVAAQLPADVSVLARSAGNGWWHVRPPPGRAKFDGYVREDRLVFK